jgi:hypothetical protein
MKDQNFSGEGWLWIALGWLAYNVDHQRAGIAFAALGVLTLVLNIVVKVMRHRAERRAGVRIRR